MTNLTDVTVAANKNAAVRDDACPCPPVYAHQNRIFTILARTKVVLCQGQRADVVPHETGHFKAFFQRIYQPPVLNLYMGHITDHAAFGVYQAWQDHRDRNQFTDFALTALDKVFNGIQQRVFQRLLSALRKRVVFFRDGFAAQIIERKGGVMTTKTYADRLKIAGFGNNGDGAAASGGGLLIDFFDQSALNELTGNFCHAGGSKLALFGYLNT